ncbi:MAG: WbqC family protein, partial [Niastella sp.]
LQTGFPNPVRYHQVFEERIGFIPNLSILDLLFCEGKNAQRILTAGG